MNKILVIGVIPPPIGGVSIHIDRFVNLYTDKEFDLRVIDLRERRMYKKGNKIIKNYLKILIFIFTSKIVHIHISHNYMKLIIAFLSKILLKRVVYTHHNSVINNKIIFKLMYKICDHIILVNDKEIDSKLILPNKTSVIPSFLPPYKFEELPIKIEKEIMNYKYIISTNCFSNGHINGRHIYGFDLIINAFHSLSLDNRISNALLLLVDPSNSTKQFVNSFIYGLNFKTNKLIIINNKIDFVSLIKKSTVTIRATRTDGDSLSIRESLYFNTPIIASSVTKRPEGTIIFQNDNAKDLANKIFSVLDKKNKLSYHHIDYGKEITNLYKKILQEKRGHA
jgi:glycosyltransferase involved in cell wall biosynthesis